MKNDLTVHLKPIQRFPARRKVFDSWSMAKKKAWLNNHLKSLGIDPRSDYSIASPDDPELFRFKQFTVYVVRNEDRSFKEIKSISTDQCRELFREMLEKLRK